jgi:lipid-binding SYLF domain-containing protein
MFRSLIMHARTTAPQTSLTSICLLGLLLALPAAADEFDKARETFTRADASAPFFDNSYGYALFPSIGKGGFGVGGARGKGRVYVGGNHVGNVTMTQLSIGLQLGGQKFSQVVFFEDERAFREFSGGNFEFGAQASAVAITASASASTSTGGSTATAAGGRSDAAVTGGYQRGFAIFTIAQGGLMYEAAVAGQKFNYKSLGE